MAGIGLSDIAASEVTVKVRGKDVEIPGVSAEGLVHLLERFPELQALLTGKADAIDPKNMLSFGAKVVSAIIAAGCGYPGDEQAEATARKLPVNDQLSLLEAVLRVTLPGGLGPFVERLAAVGNQLGAGEPTKDPATTSPQESSD